MKIVSDTSILIDFLRSKQPENSIFYRLIKSNDLIISIITVAELYSGKSAQTLTGQKKLRSLIEGLEIRIPDLDDGKNAGEMRYKYQLSIADAFIAALAMKLGLPLATLDKKAFDRINRLKLFDI